MLLWFFLLMFHFKNIKNKLVKKFVLKVIYCKYWFDLLNKNRKSQKKKMIIILVNENYFEYCLYFEFKNIKFVEIFCSIDL